MTDNINDELLGQLSQREAASRFEYDQDPDVAGYEIPNWIQNETMPKNPATPNQTQPQSNNLGKANVSRTPLGMESEWKNIPAENLPSKGFGYPPGFEIAIKAAEVREIRQFSTVDENDRIDLDDKLNSILAKCMKIRWNGGFLESFDLWYEDRFYIIMSIRDVTFIRGENKILLPVTKNCKREDCDVPDMIELRSNLLDSFVVDQEILKRYSTESYSFKFIPKDGTPELNLYIPTVGVTTICRKIIAEKRRRGKKFDESFAKVATFIIPDWRGLDESLYDQYERASLDWTPIQFSIADQITEKINFATKSRIYSKCESCEGEVTADISFPGGYRSLFVISDIFSQLL
jgi:hypothetical protein